MMRADRTELVIDPDTRNVPETSPLNATILKKIGNCDIFLADLTIVAASEEALRMSIMSLHLGGARLLNG